METEFINQTAQYIQTILRSGGPVTWSWGAEKFKATVYQNMAALQFSVSGFIHKGKVLVALNEGDDLFEVYCLDEKDEAVNSQTEVCFEDLVNVIDGMVEKNCTDAEYGRKSGEWLKQSLAEW